MAGATTRKRKQRREQDQEADPSRSQKRPRRSPLSDPDAKAGKQHTPKVSRTSSDRTPTIHGEAEREQHKGTPNNTRYMDATTLGNKHAEPMELHIMSEGRGRIRVNVPYEDFKANFIRTRLQDGELRQEHSRSVRERFPAQGTEAWEEAPFGRDFLQPTIEDMCGVSAFPDQATHQTR